MRMPRSSVVAIVVLVFGSVMLVSALTLFASSRDAFNVPHAFTPNTTAQAQQVNENFSYVEDALNEMETTGGNIYHRTGWATETISANDSRDVESPQCPSGYWTISVDCDAQLDALTVNGWECLGGNCICTYKNPTGNSYWIRARAHCLNYHSHW